MATDSETMRTLLSPPTYSAVRLAIGKAMHWHYRLFRRRGEQQAVLEFIGGMPLLVMPGVLNPRLMRTGKFFASRSTRLCPSDAEVLDMGTGSGVCAISPQNSPGSSSQWTSTRRGSLRRLNVLLNQARHKIEVHQGDLFAPVAGHATTRPVQSALRPRRAARRRRPRLALGRVAERFAAGLRAI